MNRRNRPSPAVVPVPVRASAPGPSGPTASPAAAGAQGRHTAHRGICVGGRKRRANLPADGRQLLERFEADRTAIEREADQKVEALRAEFVKTLENLQAEYTKAGKLDEALAIREYLRIGPPQTSRYYFVKYSKDKEK